MISQMTTKEALLLQGPKYIILDGDVATVYTGEDIPIKRSERNITVQEFTTRFTEAETDAFLAATKTDNAVLKLHWKLARRVEPLDLDSPEVQAGMLYLVSVEVITESRRIEILQ